MLEAPLAAGSASPSAELSGAINPFADTLEGWISAHIGLSGLAADLLSAAVILTIFLALTEAARRFITDIAPRLVSNTGSTLDDELLKAIKGPAEVLIFLAGIYLAFKTLNDLPPYISDIPDKLASVALILVGAYFVSNVISALIRWYVKDVAPKTGSDLDDHLMPFLRKFLVAVVYVVAAIMIIGKFVEITPLIAGLGVFGVAIAFAAREVLSSLFGAFAIIADRPFKAGDRLYLEGIGMGDVIDMGMRSTRIRTTDSRIVIVPNLSLSQSPIVNLSQPSSKVRLELKVGIGYGSDADKACAILEGIAAATPGVSGDPKPRAYVSALGDFAVTITLLVYVDTFTEEWSVPDAIYRNALEAFKKEGIEIPYPTVTVLPRPG